MSAIYPENKSYNSVGTKLQSLADFQNSIKQIRARMNQSASTPKPVVSTPYAGGYAPDPSGVSGVLTPEQANINEMPQGVILAPELRRSAPLAGYTDQTANPNFQGYGPSSPIETSVGPDTAIKTMPTFLGGGQYTSDPAQQGKNIKWFQGGRATNFDENAVIKAGYDPKFFEVDHEVPLALGGSDTIGNKVILAKPEHDLKSKIQQVAIQLKQDKKITDKEAQAMGMNWRSYIPYADQIPDLYDDNGVYRGLSTNQAEDVYKQFKDSPKVSWKSFISAIPDATREVKNPFVREAWKGFLDQSIPFIDYATPALKDVDTYGTTGDAKLAKFGQVAGSILGGIAGFITTAAELKLLGLGAKVGLAAKGAERAAAFSNLKNFFTLTGKVSSAAKMAVGAEELANLAKKGVPSVAAGAGIKTLEEAVTSAPLLGKGFPAQKLLSTVKMGEKLKTGGIMALIGQLHKQDAEGFGPRFKRALGDFALGTVGGGDPTKIRSYLTTFGGTATISLMMNPNIEEAVTNGAMMTALHGMTAVGPLTKMTLRGEVPEGTSWGDPHANLAKQVSEITGNLPPREMTLKEKYTPTIGKEKKIELQTKLNQANIEEEINAKQLQDSKDIRASLWGEDYNPKLAGSDQNKLDVENKILYDKMAAKAIDEGWSLEQVKDEMKRIQLTGRILYKEGLTPEARLRADAEDLWTIGKGLQNGTLSHNEQPVASNKIEEAINANPDILARDKKITLDEVAADPNNPNHFYAPGTGSGEDIAVGNKQNVKDNIANINRVMNYAKKNPNDLSIKTLTPEEKAANPMFVSKYKDYDATIADAIIIPEDNAVATKARDLAIQAKKEAGIKLEPGEANAIYNKHPEISQGIYVPIKYTDSDGKIITKLLKIGNVPRESNYRSKDTIMRNGQLEQEFKLSNHNKDTMGKMLANNGLGAVKGKVIILKDTESGYPFVRMIVKHEDIVASKVFTKDVANYHLNKQTTQITAPITETVAPAQTSAAPTASQSEPIIPPEKVNTNSITKQLDDQSKTVPMDLKETINSLEAEKFLTPDISPERVAEIDQTLAMLKNNEIPKTIETPVLAEVKAEAPIDTAVEKKKSTIPVEDLKSAKINWGKFTNSKTLTGPVEFIKEIFPEDKEILKKAKETFSIKEIKALAQEMKGKLNTVHDDSNAFVNTIENKMQELTGTDVKLPRGAKNDLARLFKNEIAQFKRAYVDFDPEKGLVVSNKNLVGASLKGRSDKMAEEWSIKNGLKEDSVVLAEINPSAKFKTAELEKGKKTNQLENLFENINRYNDLNKDTLIVASGKGNTPNDATLLKFSPEAMEKMVSTYDSNPTKYTGDNPILTNPKDKALYVYYNDIIKTPTFLDPSQSEIKGINANSAVKRGPQMFTRFKETFGPNDERPIDIHILPGVKVEKTDGIDMGKLENTTDPENAQVIKELLNRSHADGLILVGPKLADYLSKNTNTRGKKTGIKPVIQGVTSEGDYMLQKGQGIKIDDAWANFLKEEQGIDKIDPWAIYSFGDNVKLGNAKPKNGKVTMKISDIYTKNVSYKKGLKITPSFMNKFQASDDVNSFFSKLTESKKNEYNQIKEEIRTATDNGEPIMPILDKYSEKYGWNMDKIFYGFNSDIAKQGGSGKLLGKQTELLLKNILGEHVLSPTLESGGQAKLIPSVKADFDGNAIKRYAKVNEKVIGQKLADKLGVKEGDKILTGRNPLTDLTNLSVDTVRISENYGITTMNDEFVMANSHDVYLSKQADYDGDTLFMYKLGEGGLPKELGDVVQKNNKYNLLIPEAKKGEILPLSEENIKNVLRKSIIGGEMTSSSSEIARVVPMLIDQNISFKVSSGRVDVESTGKNIHSVVDKKLPKIEGSFTVAVRPGAETKKAIRIVQQLALDSSGSSSLHNLTLGDKDYLLKKILSIKDSSGREAPWALKKVLPAVKTALTVFHEPFREIKKISEFKNITDFSPKFEKFNNISKKILANGGKLSPVQEHFLFMDGQQSLGLNPEKQSRFKEDQAGKIAVEKQNPELDKIIKEKKYSPAVQEIMDDVKQVSSFAEPTRGYINGSMPAGEKASLLKNGQLEEVSPGVLSFSKEGRKMLNEKRKEQRLKLFDRLNTKLEKEELTPEDLNVLAYWTATSHESNLKQHPSWREDFSNNFMLKHLSEPKYVDKPMQLITAQEKIGKQYIKAFEEPSFNVDQMKKIKDLLARIKNRVANATPEKPVIVTLKKTDSGYTKRGAVSLPNQNVIILEPKTIQERFNNKAWTHPAVPGVNAFPDDAFPVIGDYTNFLKNHEIAHLKMNQDMKNNSENYKKLSEGERENMANEKGLEMTNLPEALKEKVKNAIKNIVAKTK